MAPLYSAIEQDLARKIQSGEFSSDQAMPTEHELCEIYGVSRITVRRAVERLVASRMIYRRRGVGTFVSPRQTDGRSLHLVGYIQDVLSFDQKLTTRVIERGLTVPPKLIQNAFQTKETDELYSIRAVNRMSRKPYAVTRTFFAPELSKIAATFHMRSGATAIRQVEEVAGIRIRSGEQTIGAAIASRELAELLDIEQGAALLSAVRFFFADGARPVEAVEVFYHPSRYNVYVELLGSDNFADGTAPIDFAGLAK